MVQFADLQPHRAAQGGVEVGQRLVEQEGRGLAHDGAADGDALALAARQLAGATVEKVGQVEDARGFGDLAVHHHLVLAGHLQREGDVVAHRHVRIERIGLEHHGQLALGRGLVGDVAAVDADGAGGGVLEPGDQAQQGGLAAAGGADEDDELAVLDVEIELRDDRRRPEGLADLVECYVAHRVLPGSII